MSFDNVYEDEERARAYADLAFPGTYFLAFRDIPALLAQHVTGTRALDFGCGAGRSTRFLRELGFDVLGADVSDAMLAEAARRDPQGNYVRVLPDDIGAVGAATFDVILCAFPFDNIPARERVSLFRQLRERLAPHGRLINLVSAHEIYLHEWLSFSTRDFPENRHARSGETVRIVMLDVPDRRPVEDVLWTEADYQQTFAEAGLQTIEVHRPLGTDGDPFAWVSETRVSPWTIHVLGRSAAQSDP